MKKKLFLALVLLNILIVVSLIMINTDKVKADERLEDFTRYAENRYLKLFVKETTTEIAIQKKENKEVWYSNPPEKSGRLKSQFSISYFRPGDRKNRLYNYSDSTEYGQYEIAAINNGVKIDYTLGEKWQDEDYLPIFVSQEGFENDFLQKMGTEEKQLLQDNYLKVSVQKI
ncbi:MAG: hypothetical protein ACOCP4_06520, partial [Candidatus Woesearchaeota archaeon]